MLFWEGVVAGAGGFVGNGKLMSGAHPTSLQGWLTAPPAPKSLEVRDGSWTVAATRHCASVRGVASGAKGGGPLAWFVRRCPMPRLT